MEEAFNFHTSNGTNELKVEFSKNLFVKFKKSVYKKKYLRGL